MAINTKNRNDLKSYFVKYAIPTEGQFADLINAQLNQADDGVFKLPGEPLSVVAPQDSGQKRALRFYADYPATNPDWVISLKPAEDPKDTNTARPGFGIADGTGNTRLFIEPNTGYLGVGTTKPEATLHVAGDLRLNIGEGLQFVGDNNYFGAGLDARILRMIDGNGSGGAVDGGLAIEGYTPTDNARKPLMTVQGNGDTTIHGNLRIEGSRSPYLDIRAQNPGKDPGIRLFAPSVSPQVQVSYWSIHNDDSEEKQLDFRYNNSSKAVLSKNGKLGLGVKVPIKPLHIRTRVVNNDVLASELNPIMIEGARAWNGQAITDLKKMSSDPNRPTVLFGGVHKTEDDTLCFYWRSGKNIYKATLTGTVIETITSTRSA